MRGDRQEGQLRLGARGAGAAERAAAEQPQHGGAVLRGRVVGIEDALRAAIAEADRGEGMDADGFLGQLTR